MAFISITMSLHAQQNKLEKMGLISELVYIKYSSEAIVCHYYDTVPHSTANNSLLFLYNTTRIMVDQMLLQLKADMNENNSVRFYKKLDKLLTENALSSLDASQSTGKMKAYINGILKISAIRDSLLSKYPLDMSDKNKIPDKSIFASTTSDVAGIWTAINATIKQNEDSKATKVTAISTLLDSLRLTSVKELTKK